jgi:hypothetical protein
MSIGTKEGYHAQNFPISAYSLNNCRPCCLSLRSFEKLRAARLVLIFFRFLQYESISTHSDGIRRDIYDADPIPTVSASSHNHSLSIYKSSSAIFAWPQLLPASQMEHGPVLYADFRRDGFSEQCKFELVARQMFHAHHCRIV